MPIATPQGTLDFKSVDKVTFVGASSNTVIDTTTGSLGVGVGVGGPTSNLHVVGNTRLEGDINMLHTANTASIKLNSNVVTEFPRSKKLIKYPRVAMTQNDESGTSGYVASAHSEYPDGTNYHAFRVFNNWGPAKAYVAGAGWESANTLTFGDDGLWGGSGASGASTSSSANTTMTLEEGNTIYGEWLQIQLPSKIRLEYVNFSPLSHYGGIHDFMGAYRSPRAGYILGSNNGINWTTLKNWSGIDYDTWVAYEHTFYKFDIDKEVDNYQYFRFVWTETSSGSGSSYSRYASCQELEFWGVPEYDPEADGTDVVVKSVPNVPNTDFLDVFVDAGNTSGYSLSGSSVTSVADLSSPANTMSVTGVTYDSTNKAFVFSGSSSSYIKATLANGNGNYAHTLSAWFMMTDYSGNWRNIIGLGTSFTNNQSAIAYDPYQDQLYYGTYGADIYVPHKPELYKWYHVAATFSGGSTTSTTMNIYLNGVNMGGVPNGTQTPSFTGDQLCIGGTMNSNGVDASNPFKGQIANARFYRRAYTSDEIYQLYAYQKEYFGHGDLSMTLKAGRLGIGTSEPRAMLDVRGASIRGPLSTFLSHDDTVQAYTNMPNAGTEYLIKSAEFEIPEVYRSLGNVNLQANSTVKWMGEISNPYNTVFRLYIEYPKGVGGVITVSTGAYLGWNTRFGHGNPAISYADSSGPQFMNTPETAIIATGHTLEDCRCNIGDKLTVKLYAASEDEASQLYTNQTQYSDNAAYNERGNTNFFIALKVV